MIGKVVLRAGLIVAVAAWSGRAVATGQVRSASPFPQAHGPAGHRSVQPTPQPPPPPEEGRPLRESADSPPSSLAQSPPPELPEITDEDRRAAFPQLDAQHVVHDDAVHYYVLVDQLEWQAGNRAGGPSWDTTGWIGGDLNRFWFRTEGEGEDSNVVEAEAHAFYGRAIARWWDLVVGIRQDLGPGPARTWAALGVQGLAPYWFEVEATAYVGESGRTQLRLETEYDLLITNRLTIQPRVEAQIYGKSDPERGIGSGLSSVDAGLRLRYELRRELAPYVGVTWNRPFFGTADLARAEGHATSGARVAVGIRVWF